MKGITKKQFERIMMGYAEKDEINKLIKIANNEISEWTKFKEHCQLLLKEKNI